MDDEALFEELRRFPQDSQIRVALAGKNFKKALQLIDKRTKNADKSSSFLTALKALVLSRMPLVTDKSFALVLIEEALEDKSIVKDLDDVELYDHALEKILPKPQQRWASIIGELRWQFVKSNPKEENASIDCFKACLLKGDLEHAIKIATSLETTFPAKREYIFWRITTTFMYSKTTRDIWGRLSLALIGKLAEATKKSGRAGASLPVQSIQKPQELLLLHLIEQSHGTPQQRLNYLNDLHLGPESPVAKEEWQLWIDKLELMEVQGQWQELFETTGSLLKRARARNTAGNLSESRYSDMIVWNGFKKSAEQLRRVNDVLSELEMHLDPNSGIDKPWRRNAAIIQLCLRFNNAVKASESELHLGFVGGLSNENRQLFGRSSAIIEYLQKYGDTSVAYEDIRPHAEILAPNDRANLLEVLLRNNLDESGIVGVEISKPSDSSLSPRYQNVTSTGAITKLVNIYKLIYLLTSCIPEFERGTSPTFERICLICTKQSGTFCKVCLSRLAKSALDSYARATEDDGKIAATLLSTDRHPADDLCIISAMCLLKLSISTSDTPTTLDSASTSNWMRAALLLEHAWSHSKSNFQISLLLVKLYSLLGCGSLAMRAYQRLSIKQIQYDTLSYTIFDRISTFHPHSFGHIPESASELRSPLDQLKDQQEMYRKAELQINKNLWRSFQLGSYSSALQFIEFSEHLSKSMAKIMSVVESRKMARFLRLGTINPSSQGYDILPSNLIEVETGFYDTNDLGSFPDFEGKRNPPFIILLCGKTLHQSKQRSQTDIVTENLMMLFDEPESNNAREKSLLWLENYLRDISTEKGRTELITTRDSFTREEGYALQIVHSLAQIVCLAQETDPNAEHWNKYNTILYDMLGIFLDDIAMLESSEPAFLSTLHALYTAYQVVIMVTDSIRYFLKRPSYAKMKNHLDKNIIEVAERLRQEVIAKSTRIRKSLDESGWMDKVMGSIAQEPDHGQTEKADFESLVDTLERVVQEPFREVWVGDVVASWKDSADGFAYFKEASS